MNDPSPLDQGRPPTSSGLPHREWAVDPGCAKPVADASSLRMLLVESLADSPANSWIPTLDRYQVDSASCLQDALQLVEEKTYDVVLLDLVLPDSQGLDAIDRLRDCRPDIPVIVQTDSLNNQLALDSLEHGAQDFVVRQHTSLDALDRAIRYAIQRQQIQRENARLVDELTQLARTDPLTGILNRHSFSQQFHELWQQVEEAGTSLSCVVLDIDFFKKINDTHGHSVGDDVIRSMAEMLSAECDEQMCLARYGGEEFCVLLPGFDEAAAHQWAESTRQRVRHLQVVVGDKPVRVSASLGVADRRRDTPSPEALLDMADQALLVAKQTGRDRVVPFQSMEGYYGRSGQVSDWRLFQGVTAVDVMTPALAMLRPHWTLADALDFLMQLRIDAAPVTDDNGTLIGVISDEDLTGFLLSDDIWARPIGDVANTNVVCFEENTSLQVIYHFFTRVSLRQVIVTRHDRPVGVISRTCVIRWFLNRWRSMVRRSGEDHDDRQEKLSVAQIAERIEHEAQELARRSIGQDPDAAHMVVGSASRMQELVEELLTQAHTGDGTDHETTRGLPLL